MAEPYLAPSLARLRTAINLRWPDRDHSSDGWIGDTAHQARVSDHNPAPSGVVRALDVDKDGVHIPTVLAAAMLHTWVRYVIHDRRIFHIDNDFAPKRYTGTNPHTEHIHVSLEHAVAAETSRIAWPPIDGTFVWPELRLGAVSAPVRQLQAFLNGHGACLRVDGVFGNGTRLAVLAFQKAKGIGVDGIVGPQTLGALRTR